MYCKTIASHGPSTIILYCNIPGITDNNTYAAVTPKDVTAYAGIHNRKTDLNGNDLAVSRIHQHHDYVEGEHPDDISILELTPQAQQKVSMNPRVKYAMLPSTYKNNYHKLTVSGWGSTDSGNLSDELQAVELPYLSSQRLQIPRKRCDEILNISRIFKTVQECQNWPRTITKKQILAGDFEEGGVDSCAGDSGGNQL